MKNKSFSNMLTYAQETLSSFDEVPFGEVDSLILSWLSYLNFVICDDITLSDIGLDIKDIFHAEDFPFMMATVKSPEDTQLLLSAVVASPRFRHIRLSYYQSVLDHDISEQFAAITFHLSPDLHYIAFRGTDCTLTGWKEDFQLSLEDPVPSQMKSLSYVSNVARKLTGSLIIGGHSKGGHLAVYSAGKVPSDIQERITSIYSHDGPGLQSNELQESGFLAIRDRIHKTLPKSSIIGMIFEQECDFDIIESNAFSVMQHNPFSWAVENGALVRCEDLTPDAKVLNKKINGWLDELPNEDRANFIEKLFSVFDETNVENFDEFGANLKENIPLVLKSIADMSHEDQFFMLKTLKKLL